MNYSSCNSTTSVAAPPRRGALIVIEGCDRTGKTTQAMKLVEYLNGSDRKAIFMRFPDRTTPIGCLIDSYLSRGVNLEDQVIHLLFSANRWESHPKIISTLKSGASVIIDRYAFSGVAFSAAKESLGLQWCKGSDAGLPKPDVVLFLDLPLEQAATRGEYGSERYEELKFQQRVYKNYMALRDDTWKMIDASKSIEEVQRSMEAEVERVMKESKFGPLPGLWWS
ncbi:thymidylate kinase-like [Portunus trituberculatus]|uniref:Thymidylate kinase n=1 Tax=Portunus trituberculatus TaxID=210409 RepID=A0A5B7DYM4_PORTR|nr:thymidylate kinase-like [Portunus trituberculatus]XP_045125874.1 thymidylate kinase-like [Portunus trituberculatus]MPC26731.1 Thymidylate kinase [Portunus trituberculatus]